MSEDSNRTFFASGQNKGGSYSDERTIIINDGQASTPGPYYQPRPAYQQNVNMRGRQKSNAKNNNTLLWVAICLSVAAITAVAVLMVLGYRNNDNSDTATITQVENTSQNQVNQNNQSQPERNAAQEAVAEVEQLPLPVIPFNYSEGESMAAAIVEGNYLGTYKGITAASFHNLKKYGKVKFNSGSSFLRLSHDDITYNFIFKNANLNNDSARLTSISAEFKTEDPWLSCEGFDSYIETHGGTLLSRASNGRSIYRTADGNYVSSGYINERFIVYFYYELFERNLIDNAAPKK